VEKKKEKDVRHPPERDECQKEKKGPGRRCYTGKKPLKIGLDAGKMVWGGVGYVSRKGDEKPSSVVPTGKTRGIIR